MSTAPQPTAAVDPNSLTPEQIADQLAQQATQTPADPPQIQREFVVQTETGQVYKGRTQAEVIEQMKKAVESGTKTIADFNKAKQQIQVQPTAQPVKPTFDNNRYYELLAVDPIAAQDYMDEIRYGVKSADIKRMVEESYGFVQSAKPQVEISNWMANSDIQSDNPETLAAFQKAWTDMGLTDADINKRNLDLVHGYCKGNGLYPNSAPAPVATTGPVTQPMPTANTTSGSNTPEPEFNALAATPEEIRAYMERKNPQNTNFF